MIARNSGCCGSHEFGKQFTVNENCASDGNATLDLSDTHGSVGFFLHLIFQAFPDLIYNFYLFIEPK